MAYVAQDGRLSADFVTGVGSAPIQYGGENNANFASFGGWVMSAPDYVKILAAYGADAGHTSKRRGPQRPRAFQRKIASAANAAP